MGRIYCAKKEVKIPTLQDKKSVTKLRAFAFIYITLYDQIKTMESDERVIWNTGYNTGAQPNPIT